MGRYPTLHEAMAEVPRSRGGGWDEAGSIAQEIAARDLWRRPSDGTRALSDQIRLRARKPEYQYLFECSDSGCSQVRLRPEARGVPATTSRVVLPKTTRQNDETIDSSDTAGSGWYEKLRTKYRPARLRVLLVGESPPDPGSGIRRFFYAPELSYDNLYRGVAEAIYGLEPEFDVRAKAAVLGRLKADGFWLIDAVECPINKLPDKARRNAIAAAAPRLVERCQELAPERGVIVCHSLVYELVAPQLVAAAVPVLHNEPLPFPLGNWRAQFVSGARAALPE